MRYGGFGGKLLWIRAMRTLKGVALWRVVQITRITFCLLDLTLMLTMEKLWSKCYRGLSTDLIGNGLDEAHE